jgi:hypothetical protein
MRKGLEAFSAAVALDPWYALACVGQADNGLERAATERYVAPAQLAAVYSGLGEVDGASAALERAIQNRSFSLVTPKTHPMFDPLRADPRSEGWLRSAGL